MRSNTEGWSNQQLNDRIEFLEDKLGDISRYPEIKFGHMTVLDYLDLVELQADTYTKRALIAEQKLRDTILIVKEITEGKGRYDRDSFTHCRNTVEDMKALAEKALKPLTEEMKNESQNKEN